MLMLWCLACSSATTRLEAVRARRTSLLMEMCGTSAVPERQEEESSVKLVQIDNLFVNVDKIVMVKVDASPSQSVIVLDDGSRMLVGMSVKDVVEVLRESDG